MSYAATTAQADRLEQRERDEELATLVAAKMIAAQQAQQSAATAPITRAAFDRLSPAEKMATARSRRIVD